MTPRAVRPTQLLRLAIASSFAVESATAQKRLRHPLPLAGFGFLVRNRRLAQAIQRLGIRGAYESRVLMRTMLEIQINYAWIRLRNSYSRALRYHRFIPLEQLKVLKQMNTLLKQDDYDNIRGRLEAERRRTRHLFRFRDSKNKLQWSKTWAAVSSVEARVSEVLSKERPGKQVDPFHYGMYISFSSATHGSPGSVSDVLRIEDDRLVARQQPETNPAVHQRGAAILLAWTIDAFTEDARLRRRLRAELRPLKEAIAELRARAYAAGHGS